MPLIKKTDSKAVTYVLTKDEKQTIKDKKRSGTSKADLLAWARNEFADKDAKRMAAARMIENLFLTAK